MQSEHVERLARQRIIFERLADLIAEDPERTAVDLASAALPLLAKKYPANKSRENIQAIKKNFPDATDELIAERALNPTGAELAIQLGTTLASMAVDYVPGTLPLAAVKQDSTPAATAAVREVTHRVSSALDAALASGASLYGATASAVINAAAIASHKGLSPLMICRIMFETVASFGPGGQSPLTQPSEDQLLEAVAQQMGISVKEARRYLDAARSHPSFRK